MRRSNGFLALPLAGYAAIVALAVMGGLGLWGYVEKTRYDALKAEYDAFRGGVEALGLAAKKATADKEAADAKRKADTDALHQAAVDALNADIRRLSSQRARGGGLSNPAPVTTGIDRACFDPTGFNTALRSLDEGVFGIAETGAKAVIDLDAVKRWAQSGHAP